MKANELERIRALLGHSAVLLPIPEGSKAPRLRRWSNVTLAETQTPEYEKKLLRHGNIGVLLGKPSLGLCSIDIDSDDQAERFLFLNPKLEESLQTKGKGGQNIWVQIEGEFPALRELKLNREHWGEWRSDGGLTVIAGIHPSGIPYQFLKEAPPIRIKFREISWPSNLWEKNDPILRISAGWAAPPIPSPSPPHSSISSTSSISPASLHHKSSPEEEISHPGLAVLESAHHFRQSNPELDRLYDQLVGQRYEARQGSRNSSCVEMVTFLYRAVSRSVAMRLVENFYDASAPIWEDPKEQHLREAAAHLEAVEKTYLGELSPLESRFYQNLSTREQDVFRICRDLARRKTPEFEPGQFFLSYGNAATRVGGHSEEVYRILEKFVQCHILRMVRKGEKRCVGKKGRATIWEWILESPPTGGNSFESPPTCDAISSLNQTAGAPNS